ncbi:hypothetical protein C1645_833821 [Glomus cerebriforme]|uniref:Uncharacterized protein n=1 Tax=Glomus cerebriforme TaxID=658196 RepID=A0A397SD56_9GLOM|nr:hypothetical protein C1645_833821 [Glomus cerebriforme]
MGTVADSNEAVRCEYISIILHACIGIVKKLTGKEISLNPQLEVVGEERLISLLSALKNQLLLQRENNIKSVLASLRMLCNAKVPTKLTRKRKADGAFGEEYDYLYRIHHHSHGVVLSPLYLGGHFMYE